MRSVHQRWDPFIKDGIDFIFHFSSLYFVLPFRGIPTTMSLYVLYALDFMEMHYWTLNQRWCIFFSVNVLVYIDGNIHVVVGLKQV